MAVKHRIQIDPDEDIMPRTTARQKKKQYKIRWTRNAMARFFKEQMFYAGYFVGSAVVKKRNPNAGKDAARDQYVGTRGRFRGVWAWKALSLHSGLCVGTLKKLAFGEHKRSAEFKTVICAFKALGVELVGVESDDYEVTTYLRGW